MVNMRNATCARTETLKVPNEWDFSVSPTDLKTN